MQKNLKSNPTKVADIDDDKLETKDDLIAKLTLEVFISLLKSWRPIPVTANTYFPLLCISEQQSDDAVREELLQAYRGWTTQNDPEVSVDVHGM